MRVTVSRTFQKQLERLPAQVQTRITKSLRMLQEDARRPRSGADIKQLAGSDPPKFRLRVGDYRVVYAIEGENVKVAAVFARGRGYGLD